MPVVTALSAERRGRVAVELDGTPWRVLPAEVVVGSGLTQGHVLDRATLRELRRGLKRREALDLAARTLRFRDLSAARLHERLARADVPPVVVTESLATLERAGLVDDERVAQSRAQALAGRGYGDEAIRHKLAAEGLGATAVAAAVAVLDPESERAARVVERRGRGAATARYLAGRGFAEEAVEVALDTTFGQDP